MTTQQQTERDDALIAEKKRLADELERMYNGAWADDAVTLRHAAALLRGDEPAKPDDPATAGALEILQPYKSRLLQYRGDNFDDAVQSTAAVLSRLLSEAEERGRQIGFENGQGLEREATAPAKPDRYLEIWKEANQVWRVTVNTDGQDDQAAAAVLRRHFEPPSEVVKCARIVREKYAKERDAAHVLADFILKGDQ